MALLDLANELLHAIAENLGLEKDINAFALTNRRLYSLLNSYLYRRNVQQFGSSALLWAAKNGQEGTAQRLLVEGASVQATEYGLTQLLFAARNGYEAVAELLLACKDIDADRKDTGGRSPLSYAADNGSEAVVRLLLAKGLDPDSKDSAGRTPLSFAAQRGSKTVIELLLSKNGVDPDSKD